MENNNLRIENVLVLLLLQGMKEATVGEKATLLSDAGFSHSEIGKFLNTTSGVIKQSVYITRKGKKK